MSVNLFCLVDEDFLNEHTDKLRIEFLDVCILSNQREEGINAKGLVFCVCHKALQFCDAPFKLSLFGFVGGGQLGKTLIGNLPLNVVLVEPLDNAIEFADTSLGCLKFLFALTKVALGLLLGLLCYKPRVLLHKR